MKAAVYSLRIICLISLTTACFAEDWPQWRGIKRDGKSPETGLKKSWPSEGLEPLWVVEDVGKGFSAVTVARGLVYVTGMVEETGEGILYAFDLAGGLRWQTPYGPEWNEGAYTGSRTSATITGDAGYIMSGTGRLVCFDATTGKERWAKDVRQAFGAKPPFCGFAESVLIYKGTVICTPGAAEGSLAALDKETGDRIWVSNELGELSAYCSPILVHQGQQDLLVTMTAMSVFGMNPATGEVFWRFPQDPDAEDQNHSVTPVCEDGRVYVTSGHAEGGRMFALSPDGREAHQEWADQILNCLHGGVVVVDGYVYGTNSKGRWVCLNLATGQVTYNVRGVGRGSVAYADGMLYCYGEKGNLGLVTATPEGFNLAGSFEITHGDGPHWAHPVISGGRLYIRHGHALMAFDLTREGRGDQAPSKGHQTEGEEP